MSRQTEIVAVAYDYVSNQQKLTLKDVADTSWRMELEMSGAANQHDIGEVVIVTEFESRSARTKRMTPRFIMVVVGPRDRTLHWLQTTRGLGGVHVIFVNELEDVKKLQGFCIDKRVKDEVLVDLTKGDPVWREILAYVEMLFG